MRSGGFPVIYKILNIFLGIKRESSKWRGDLNGSLVRKIE